MPILGEGESHEKQLNQSSNFITLLNNCMLHKKKVTTLIQMTKMKNVMKSLIWHIDTTGIQYLYSR